MTVDDAATQTAPRSGPRFGRSSLHVVGLVALLLVSFTLRAWNLNWDHGQHQHPDERFWSDVANRLDEQLDPVAYPDGYFFADPARSRVNPYNVNPTWVYGTSPLILTKTLANSMLGPEGQGNFIVDGLDAVGVDLKTDEGWLRFNDRYDVNIFGRLISALIDTMTVALVYALGRELGGRNVGLLGAALATFSVMNIQYAHFFGAEPWVTFLSTAAVLGSVRLAKGSTRLSTRLLTGLVLGLAVATKLSGVAVFAAPAIATAVAAFAPGGDYRARGWRTFERASAFVAMAIIALVTFRIAQPFVFQGGLNGMTLKLSPQFLSDIDYLSDVNSGGNAPWVVQWVNRSPLLYPLSQVFWWGMGPGLALASLAGLGVSIWAAVRRQRWYLLVPAGFVLAFLVLVSRQFNALDRYLLPAYPTAIALAAFGMVTLWNSEAPRRSWLPTNLFGLWRPVARFAIAAAVLTTAFWGTAFVNGVYNTDHSRVIASTWMAENMAPNTLVTSQIWDDALPLYAPDVPQHTISSVPLDPYGGENPDKIHAMIDVLDQVEYIVESSNRLYGSIPRMPARYPVTREYYHALFDGELGFELAAEFTTPPKLFGIEIDDRNAEETFTVYDHPKVTIWKKTAAFSVESATARLQPDRAAAAVDFLPREGTLNGLQLSPVAYEAQQSGGTYSDIFDDDGFTSNIPWLWWMLWLQLAAFAVLPMSTWIFRRLPDHGYGFSKILGLIAVGLPIWILTSAGLVQFGGALVWAMLGIVAVAGIGFAWAEQGFGKAMRQSWQSWLAAELVFLAIFAAVLALRYANPDVWFQWRGGEKPMELAYFTAITRSSTFPAYDPWFAGGYLNYYYVGWYFLALPTRALRLAPDIAFNLGIATYASLAAATVYSVVRNMTGLAMPLERRRSGRGPIGAGVLGVTLFLLIGNYDTLRLQVGQFREAARGNGHEGGAISETIWGFVWWITGGDLPRFDWWAPSRVNKGLYPDDRPIFDITEFPSWTTLFGDLHPHFMGMPFFGLMLGTAMAAVVSTRALDAKRSWAFAAMLGMVVGLVRMVHTWDWPTVLVLGAGAVVVGQFFRSGRRVSRWAAAIGQLVVFVVSYQVTSGAYSRANLADSGFEFFHGFTTNLDDYIAHWAPFLIIGFGYVMFRIGQLRQFPLLLMCVFGIPAVIWLHITVGSVAAWSAVGIMLAGFLVIVEATDERVSVPHLSAAAFFSLGFGIMTFVEVVRLSTDIDRFNTIFKFWLQVWQLFAVACAFGVWWVARSLKLAASARRAEDRPSFAFGLGRTGWLSVVGVLVILGLVFPLRATPARLLDRFDTNANNGLDGYAWLTPDRQMSTYEGFDIKLGDDIGLIEWLRDNVEGSPTIVEAIGESYTWHGRVTVMTGLPAVIGWNWHQRQQRTVYSQAVDRRWSGVDQFYNIPDVNLAESFLRTYDVTYVIVGSTERSRGQQVVFDMFATMDVLTPVFDDGVSKIYEVDKALLAQRSPVGAMFS